MTLRPIPFLFAILLSVGISSSASALDAPTVTPLVQGFGKAVLEVRAGETGAPNGFTIWWMRQSDFDANGGQMFYGETPLQGIASFTGTPTLNTWDGTLDSFTLAPGASAKIEIGDLDDETGVWSNLSGELTAGVAYVFCVSANDASGTYYPASAFSTIEGAATRTGQDCTYTQGYWKNHEEAWPVTSLFLGNTQYSQAQLLAILGQPVQGNGLVSLARQLISTKLNIAQGSAPAVIAATVLAADTFIGPRVIPPIGGDSVPPSQTSSMTQSLDDYNNGITGPGHCPPVSVDEASWGSVKALYR